MKKLIVLLIVLCAMFVGCTPQQRAKKYGGNATVNLPPGTKLIVATWKNDDLWYLIGKRADGEAPQVYTFSESSSWGVLQGNIIFHER